MHRAKNAPAMDKSPTIDNAQTDRAMPSKSVKPMWGIGLDGWNSVQIGFLAIAAAAAIAVGVSQFVIIKLQKAAALEAEIEFNKYKLGVDAKVAEAKTQGIAAGKTAGDALLRAATLEKEAANARLETEKLKAVVAWRTLSETQATNLGNVLSAKPGAVNLRWTDGDPEALFFAIQISQILQRAGWKVAPGSFKPANRILFGIVLPPDAGADMQTLREAFTAAKIGVSIIPFPQDGPSFNVSIIAGAPFLMIGSRLPVVP